MPFVSQRVGLWRPLNVSRSRFRDLTEGTSYFSTFTCVCSGCGMVFAKHRFSDVEMALLYNDYRGVEYCEQRIAVEPSYKSVDMYLSMAVPHIADIEENIVKFLGHSDINLLDWGGGEGLNTPCKSYANNICIFDISKENHFSILKGLETSDFNVIICMHVLEHVSFPSLTLEGMLKYSRKGTLVYLEVPLEAGINAKLGGLSKEVERLHWHEHINCFSLRPLMLLMEKQGVKVVYSHVIDLSDGFRDFKAVGVYGFV